MIPTMITVGLILGVIPALRWRLLAIAALVASIAWALVIAFGVDGSSTGDAALGFVLALINTGIGIAIGVGIVALIRRLRRGSPAHPAG